MGKWTLSKGSLEGNEDLEDGLKRVIKDEVEININPIKKIGLNTYKAYPPEGPVQKEVTYFLSEASDVILRLKDTKGLDKAKWFTFQESKNLSFYQDLKQIIFDGMEEANEIYAKQSR